MASSSRRRSSIATGGLSIPKIGATADSATRSRVNSGLRFARRAPALFPCFSASKDRANMVRSRGHRSRGDRARAGTQSFRENMLITHRGLSGPAILQISSYWNPASPIHLDLAPGQRDHGDAQPGIGTHRCGRPLALKEFLPQSLAARWFEMNAPARVEQRLHRAI